MTLVLLECEVQLVPLELKENKACLEEMVKEEILDHLDPKENRDFKDYQDFLEIKETGDIRDQLDLKETGEEMVSLGMMDLLDFLECLVKWGQEDFLDLEGFQVFQAHLGYLEQKVAKEQREMKGQMDLQVHLAKLVAKDLLDHQ